jgi:flagellar basal body rod protein FlgG
VTEDDRPVLGTDGKPITLGQGEAHVDEDGTVWAGTMQAGRLAVVTFKDPSALTREDASRFAADGQTAAPVNAPTVRAGSLEQSNVSVADRLAELTSVSRGFEALQKSMSVLMNDIDGRAIDRLGRL